MKRLLLLSAFALSGCGVVDAFLMTKYDPNEYDHINHIRVQAAEYKTQCDDAALSRTNAAVIVRDTQAFEFYSEHVPRNDDGYAIAKNINEMAQGLKKQYDTNPKVSAVFCKFKFEGIERSAEIAQKTIGARPR